VLFPTVYHRFCHMLSGSRPYILEGRVEEDFGSITLTVERIGLLDRYGQGRNGRARQRARKVGTRLNYNLKDFR